MAIAPIKQVAIIGGTHGNEWTGIYLVKKFQQYPDLVKRPSLQVKTLLANPKAIALNRRYVERDLNRCFGPNDLANLDLKTYEDQRAKAIAAQLCPPNAEPTDFILDIHSTTANMELTLLLSSDHPFNLRLAAYLSHINPKVKVCFREQNSQKAPMLRSLSPLGLTLEVGPIEPGVLRAIPFQQTEQLILAILDYVEAWNQNQPPSSSNVVTVYQSFDTLDYPRNARGEITAMIHPERQGQDFQPLRSGCPLFLTFEGDTIGYEGNEEPYPIFINEAAYYEKKMAMALTHKRSIIIQP